MEFRGQSPDRTTGSDGSLTGWNAQCRLVRTAGNRSSAAGPPVAARAVTARIQAHDILESLRTGNFLQRECTRATSQEGSLEFTCFSEEVNESAPACEIALAA